MPSTVIILKRKKKKKKSRNHGRRKGERSPPKRNRRGKKEGGGFGSGMEKGEKKKQTLLNLRAFRIKERENGGVCKAQPKKKRKRKRREDFDLSAYGKKTPGRTGEKGPSLANLARGCGGQNLKKPPPTGHKEKEKKGIKLERSCRHLAGEKKAFPKKRWRSKKRGEKKAPPPPKPDGKRGGGGRGGREERKSLSAASRKKGKHSRQ